MRIGHVKVEELFATTDWCIKNTFPADYDARCLYSACAIHSILKNEGIKAIIVGGNVGAFTMSSDGRQALVEGFGGGDVNQPSHYWVEVDGFILDPNVSYLPKSSRIQAVPMPMIAWDKNTPMPQYLQYKYTIRYSEEVEYVFPNEILVRISDFIESCKKRYSSKAAKKKLSTWLLASPKDLNNAAKAGDKWASGAIRFQSMRSAPRVPA